MPAQQWRDVIAICNRDTYARVNNITIDGYSIVAYRSGSELKPRRHQVNNAIEAKFCTFALDVCVPIRDFLGKRFHLLGNLSSRIGDIRGELSRYRKERKISERE